jgi:hypothetical protein
VQSGFQIAAIGERQQRVESAGTAQFVGKRPILRHSASQKACGKAAVQIAFDDPRGK